MKAVIKTKDLGEEILLALRDVKLFIVLPASCLFTGAYYSVTSRNT